MPARPGASRAPFLFLFLAALASTAAGGVALSATDPIVTNRAYFPDREWAPQTAADAALVGSARVSDPLASWVVNPALCARLARAGPAQARLGGLLLNPDRNDIASSTIDYSDTSPYVTFAESGVAIPAGDAVVLLALDQPSFHREETAFLDTTAGSPPTYRSNTDRSYVQRLTGGYARAFGTWSAGLVLQAYRVTEAYETVPSEDAIAFGAVPGSLDLSGTGYAGTIGLAGRPASWISAGTSYRVSTDMDLEDPDGNVAGHDEVPSGFDLGATLGQGLGGNLSLGAAWSGERQAMLPDSLGRGADASPARWSFAGGYTYRSRGAPWEFRAGYGWTPRPADGGGRATRFGVGLAYDVSGVWLRASFASESVVSADGAESSRGLFLLTVDFDL
jgi:hypothetical protein